MTTTTRRAVRLGAAFLVLTLLQLATTFPALATPAPRRPHPHRKPWPITLTVRTVPALPGLRIRLDDRTAVTDSHGEAGFTEEHNFSPHTLRLLDTSVDRPARRLRFVRWAGQRDPDQAFGHTVTGLPMRMSYTVTAAFAVQVPVQTSLVNMQGRTVDPARVTAVTLRSGRTGVVNVPASGQLWLDSVIPVYRNSTIALENETYTLTSVIVGGTNTVDAGRQRFVPARQTRPVFRTKFFGLTVSAHDLLFKGRSGTAARITYPDGSVHTFPFAANGRAAVLDLPRGTYEVTVLGGGTPLPSQLVLSRNATLDLAVGTHRDYAAVGGALAVVMTGLVLIGRGRRRVVRLVRGLLSQPVLRPRWARGRAGSDPGGDRVPDAGRERETV
jgi:hypothetical protein